MRRHKIIINGKDAGVVDAGWQTAIERQHALAEETGGFVRVKEYVTQRPSRRRMLIEEEVEE